MHSKKYLLVQHLILLTILVMSLIVVRGNGFMVSNPMPSQDEYYYTINVLNETYGDIDGDGYSDTVYLHLQLAGPANTEVNIIVNITQHWDKPYYFSNDVVYTVALDNSGYGYFDYNMTASRTTTYDIFFLVKDPDTGEYLTSLMVTEYLDGLFKDWIPKPQVEMSISYDLQDDDGDGYGDKAIFHFHIVEQNDPLYMDSVLVRYDLFGQLGEISHFEKREVYVGSFSKVDNNDTFDFDVHVQINVTANYLFYFYIYDQYNRYITYDLQYLGRVDGYGDTFFTHTVEGGLNTVCTTPINGDLTNAINISSWLYYTPGDLPPANYLNVRIDLWYVNNGIYWNGQDYVLGEGSYIYDEVSFDVFINDTAFSISNSTIFDLAFAGRYFVVYTVTDYNGVVWVNSTAEVVALVGVRPGDNPLSLLSISVHGTDLNRDGNEDGLIFNATIQSDLIMNYTVHVVLAVEKIENNGSVSLNQAMVYYNDILVEVHSPTVFNVSDYFQSTEEADYRITWSLFYDDYDFNCSMILFNDTIHLYNSETITTTTTTTTTNTTTTPTTSTTSSTSSSSNSSSSSSSEDKTELTTSEPTTSNETSESPQLPLPFSYTGVIAGLSVSSFVAVYVRKRTKR